MYMYKRSSTSQGGVNVLMINISKGSYFSFKIVLTLLSLFFSFFLSSFSFFSFGYAYLTYSIMRVLMRIGFQRGGRVRVTWLKQGPGMLTPNLRTVPGGGTLPFVTACSVRSTLPHYMTLHGR